MTTTHQNLFKGISKPKPNTVKLKLPNGATYEGQVLEGKPEGRGKMFYNNSERYEGDFIQGQKHGKGKYYYMKGELYIGDWFQNKKHGKGQYFYGNGTIYNGEFVDNKKHGQGKIQQPNGSYFQGEFNMNNKEKTGYYYDAIMNKKYLVVHENGQEITREEVYFEEEEEEEEGDQEDLDEYQDSDDSYLNKKATLKKDMSKRTNREGERQILSLDVYGNEMNSKKSINYVSQKEDASYDSCQLDQLIGQSNSKSSSLTLIADNYVDPLLLATRINQWTHKEVSSWLNQIGFGDCTDDFKENYIEGDSLLVLQNEDLKELGVSALGDRRILMREIEFLKMIFKNQCLQDTYSKFIKREITIELVKQISQKRQKRQQQLKQARNNTNHHETNSLSSSTSSSSSDDDRSRQKYENKQKQSKLKLSMQSKVERYLEKKGIKLTFLIPKDQIKIIEQIGKGGYGQVFLGKWLGQDVAVKKYLKKQGFRNRHIGNFIEEIQVISKLNHPCIILYMGMSIQDNEYFLVTEFLSGGSLFDLLHKRKEEIEEEHIISISKDIAQGMAYLHSKDVLHCDLKSSNVLIDQSWNVKLCDFGLSRVNSTKNKKINKNIRVGTPHWMAPQILKGSKYLCESDVYSFGILLWEMLTGQIPYKDLSTAQIIGLVGNDDSHHISTPLHSNQQLIDIFNMCTERQPTKRPSFKDIVKKLEQIQKRQVYSTMEKLL